MKKEMNGKMKLRAVAAGDELLLFAWKNDPVTVENSKNQEPVLWENHLLWFADAICDPRKVMCIAEIDGVPIGLVRSGPNQEEQIEVCFTVAPEWRHQAVETVMVDMFMRLYVPDASKVVLPIRLGNATSEGTAVGLGYLKLMRNEEHLDDVAKWALPTTSDA